MSRSTMSSREFNQDTAGAKRAAEHGPVYITDRGRPAHVLLSYESYVTLVGDGQSIVELLSGPSGAAAVEFDPPRINGIAQPADLSD